jgi:diguanylate cyclase (GGDEF)-like protein
MRAALVRICCGLAVVALLLAGAGRPAHALQPIDIGTDAERLELAPLGVALEGRGDSLQIEMARAADGTVGRMAVRAVTPGTSPRWFVFALINPTDKPAERWLVAERYNHAGSGVVWPDLDARRLENVTPSLGFLPERLPFDNADAFRLSVEPGQTVTFAVELAGDRVPRLQLWKGLDYEKRNRNRQLFHGILLGMTGLLALFLTVIFAANHKAIFPAAALFTWAVLAYLCVDFGFWHRLFNVKPEENAVYRAAGEALMALSLLVFSATFLRLFRWHALIRLLLGLAVLGLIALFALAFLDPRLASMFSRLSLAGVLALSALVTLYLTALRQDRALAIVPTWVLFSVWVFGAALVLSGRLGSDIVVNGLTAGLVLLTVLIGFTVTQFAFRTVDPVFGGSVGDQQLRALAVDGSGSAVFDWNAARDEIRLGPQIDAALGLEPAERQESVTRFIQRLHMADRERMLQMLGALRDRGTGTLDIALRLRHVDTTYRWFDIEASVLPASDRNRLRAVGLMRETTDQRRGNERLLQDTITDSLTALPNRALFLDRVEQALGRARSEPLVRPLVVLIDLDRFRSINQSVGYMVADSLLMALARRLQRLVQGADSLGRVGGDRFALLLVGARDERELRLLGEDVRAAVKGPIVINGQEIVLTGSIGIARHDPAAPVAASDLLDHAEAAMLKARRGGPDRVEMFVAGDISAAAQRADLEAELAGALDRKQIRIEYRPIVHLHTEALAGFEAHARWDHPTMGPLDPLQLDLPPAATAARLGAAVLQAATAEARRWQKEFDEAEQPVFVAVNLTPAQVRSPELLQEIRHLFVRGGLPKGSLRLEVPETVVLDNPEQATELLQSLSQLGAKLVLDGFGAGYSSLAFLGRFKVDGVKIDGGLVAAAARSAEGTAVVRSIVALAHELGKTVIADAVETDEVVALLRTIGCEMAQGELYGPVMSARDALQRVKQERRDQRRTKRGSLFRVKPKRGEDAPVAGNAAPGARPIGGAAEPLGEQAVRQRLVGQRPATRPDVAAPPVPSSPAANPRQAPLQPRQQPPQTPPVGRPAMMPTPPAAVGPAYAPAAPNRTEVRALANEAVEQADRALARLKDKMVRSIATSTEPPTVPLGTGQPAHGAAAAAGSFNGAGSGGFGASPTEPPRPPLSLDQLLGTHPASAPPQANPMGLGAPLSPPPVGPAPAPAAAPTPTPPLAPGSPPATGPAPTATAALVSRPTAPIDVSKLPAALAASLTRLSGQQSPPEPGRSD